MATTSKNSAGSGGGGGSTVTMPPIASATGKAAAASSEPSREDIKRILSAHIINLKNIVRVSGRQCQYLFLT